MIKFLVSLLLLLPLVSATCRKGPCSSGYDEYLKLMEHRRSVLISEASQPITKPDPISNLQLNMVSEFDQIFELYMVANRYVL